MAKFTSTQTYVTLGIIIYNSRCLRRFSSPPQLDCEIVCYELRQIPHIHEPSVYENQYSNAINYGRYTNCTLQLWHLLSFRFVCACVCYNTQRDTHTTTHESSDSRNLLGMIEIYEKKRKISRNVICMNAFHKWCAIISWQKEEWFSILHTCISVLLDTEETM